MNPRQLVKDASLIPPGPYCYADKQVCVYWDKDETRPYQENGYCHFLEQGDWESPSVGLLWDQCKECGIRFDEGE